MTKRSSSTPISLIAFGALAGVLVAVLAVALLATSASAATSAAPGPQGAAALPVIDDFESGMPAGWFQYGDSGTSIAPATVATSTVPGAATNHVLQLTYTSAGWGAGTGHDLGGQDWSTYDGLAFWFKGLNTGATFRIILSDNPNPAVPGDSAERFAFEFKDDSTAWRHINIPWGAFFRDPGFQPGGAPNDGLTLTQVMAYALALPSGTHGNVYVDDVRLVKQEKVDDFQTPLPASWFAYGDYGSGTSVETTLVPTTTVPGGAADNQALKIKYTSAGWGAGTGHDLGGKDWSASRGMAFWFFGSNSGATYRVILSDNPNPAVPGDSAERFAYEFKDSWMGWQYLSIPWSLFFRDPGFQPGGAPNDGLTLTQVMAYALALPAGTRTAYVDQVALFGDPKPSLTVAFDRQAYSVKEGATVTITATLSAAATQPVTVTYATSDATAKAGKDYTATSGQLVFAPGVTAKTFTVATLDNKVVGPDLLANLTLSNAVNAELGSPKAAALKIANVDEPDTAGATIVDDFENGLPSGKDANGVGVGFVTWNGGGSTAAITTTVEPAPLPQAAATNHVLKLDANVVNWGGFTHAFTNAAADEWLSQDWGASDGFMVWVYGSNSGTDLFIDILDNRNPGSKTDDAERYSYSFKDDTNGWKRVVIPWASFGRKDIGNGAPNDGLNLNEVYGWAFGALGTNGPKAFYLDNAAIWGNANRPLLVQVEYPTYTVNEGRSVAVNVTTSVAPTQTVTVKYATVAGAGVMAGRDFTAASGTLTFPAGVTKQTVTVQTLDDGKYGPDKLVFLALSDPTHATLGGRKETKITIAEKTPYDPAMLDDFETGAYLWQRRGNVTLSTVEVKSKDALALPIQGPYENVLKVEVQGPPAQPASNGMDRPFAAAQDWRSGNALTMWYYGQKTGKAVQVELRDNRAPDPGPAGWQLVWSDEFNTPAGTAPDQKTWTPEIGDGKLNGNPGWGNSELEYYTNSTDNAATDGQGNLVITARKLDLANNSLECYYGPCQYTSARLISANKAEFAHGRIEARIKVPAGQGIWPAFWMLGSDIYRAGWPQSGEIDIMENIGKEPATVHGTIHGPGYSGGNGIGGGYELPSGKLADAFHLYAIEWQPGRIRWFIDGTNYFTATTSSLPAGANWVYDHPFFLILNVAVGGGWPGYPDETTVFPQTMQVDYVRVYQAPDSAERFQASFTDNFSGWRKLALPFRKFTRAAAQPAGAPNDGLTLSEVWGYGFTLPSDIAGPVYLDQTRVGSFRPAYLPLMMRR